MMQYGMKNALKIVFEMVNGQQTPEKINQKPQISSFSDFGIFADMGLDVAYCYGPNIIPIFK